MDMVRLYSDFINFNAKFSAHFANEMLDHFNIPQKNKRICRFEDHVKRSLWIQRPRRFSLSLI